MHENLPNRPALCFGWVLNTPFYTFAVGMNIVHVVIVVASWVLSESDRWLWDTGEWWGVVWAQGVTPLTSLWPVPMETDHLSGFRIYNVALSTDMKFDQIPFWDVKFRNFPGSLNTSVWALTLFSQPFLVDMDPFSIVAYYWHWRYPLFFSVSSCRHRPFFYCRLLLTLTLSSLALPFLHCWFLY